MSNGNTPINENAAMLETSAALGHCAFKGGRKTMQENHTSKLPQEQSTLAPSEKHLEDWIVKNFHGFGTIWQDGELPDICYPEVPYRIDNSRLVSPFFNSIVGRQFPLPSGRPDLLARNETQIAAIEIKKGAITYETIGQCLRYMYDLRQIFYRKFHKLVSGWTNDGSFQYEPDGISDLETHEYPQSEIFGLVVGHSLQDKNIALVASVARIQVVTYTYDGFGYQFNHETIYGEENLDYGDYVNGSLGGVMASIMVRRSKRGMVQS